MLLLCRKLIVGGFMDANSISRGVTFSKSEINLCARPLLLSASLFFGSIIIISNLYDIWTIFHVAKINIRLS